MNGELPQRFNELIGKIGAAIGGRSVEPDLARFLNSRFPAGGAVVRELEELCHQGCREGWLCARAAGGIRFGRAIKPSPATYGFSVDVVDMPDVVGPHHTHPYGEIDLVLPVDDDAQFDGSGAGWKVYGPGSAHNPTVTGGRALVLYLLPDGAIEFTRA